MNDKVKGYLLGIVAAVTYGMNPLFALPLYENDMMNPDSVLLFRYLFAIPIIAVMLLSRGHSLKIARNEILPLAIMGVLMAVSSLALFQSYNYMAAGIASTILFVYPIMVAVIMAIVFKEKVTLQTALCILMALAGIGLLYKSSDGSTLNLTGTILVMVSALSYAVYMVGVNNGKMKNMPTLKLTFYVLTFGVVLYVVRILFGGELTLPSSEKWYLWFNLLALAVFPTLISFACITSAIKYIGSTPTAILGALEPVTAIFFGITVFGETVTSRDVLGIVMIIVAVSFVVAGKTITNSIIRLRKMFPRILKKK